MLGRQRRIDYEKFQIVSIVRNNPGITSRELLLKLQKLHNGEKWSRLKIYRRIDKMISIKIIVWYNKEIKRFEYKYFVK